MENVGNAPSVQSAHFTSPQPALPSGNTSSVRPTPQQRSIPPVYPSGKAAPGDHRKASFATTSDDEAPCDSFESLVHEVVTLDLRNSHRRPAPKDTVESLLRRLVTHGFDSDDLREIIRACPGDERWALELLESSVPKLAPRFTPSQLVSVIQSGGDNALFSLAADSPALFDLGHSAADILAVAEKTNSPGRGLTTLIISTRDLAKYGYDAPTVAEIAITWGLNMLDRLALLAPKERSAGYPRDKLLELLKTGGAGWAVREALSVLARLRFDKMRLLDCFEPEELADIAIKGGADSLNALRELWPNLAQLDSATGKYVPSILSTAEIYDLACVPDGGEGLRNAALARGMVTRSGSPDDTREVGEWDETLG